MNKTKHFLDSSYENEKDGDWRFFPAETAIGGRAFARASSTSRNLLNLLQESPSSPAFPQTCFNLSMRVGGQDIKNSIF